jgi:P4 family phage/plasmid primase-like protien
MNKHVKSDAVDPRWSDPNAAVDFLQRLRPDGPWVLSAGYATADAARVAGDVGPMPTRSFRDPRAARAWIAARSGRANIYYTLNRTGEVSKKPSKADIIDVEYLHVDIDSDEHGPLAGDEERKKALVTMLRQFAEPGAPSFIIDSGGGLQALWAIGPGHDNAQMKSYMARANQALIDKLGGDYGTWNLDRLLRLPGTINLPNAKKLKGGRLPAPARLLESSGQTHEDWTFELVPEGQRADVETEFEIGEAIEVGDLDSVVAEYDVPERVIKIIEDGRLETPKAKDDSRSTWLFDAICGLVRAGVPPELILGIITDPQYDISETVLEKPDPEGYAERQIRSAYSKVALGQARDLQASGATEEGVWPRQLRYVTLPVPNNARNGRIFVMKRPQRMVTSDGATFSLARSGIWTEIPEEAIRAEMRATNLKDTLQVSDISAMVKAVGDLTHTAARPFEWIDPPGNAPASKNLVLFRNGVLNLETSTLMPLDGSYFATALPNFDYEPNAQCPSWLTWIDERLDPSFHATLQEWMGYVMVPDTTAHRFATFTGPPRSGKSTSKNIIEQLVGTDHISRKQLADMGKEFGLQDTIDKRLIVIPDAKDAPASQRGQALERILAVTGGDITGIPRKYLPAVSVKLLTRLLVLGNRQPAWIDESGALAARQIAIVFDRSFEGKEEQRVEDGLIAELPGIANWALEGLQRLRANDYKFSVGEAGKAVVAEVRRGASPALRFAEDCLEVTGNQSDMVQVDQVYTAYRDWVEREGIFHPRNKTDLMTDLTTSLHNVRLTQTRKLHAPGDWKGDEYRPRVLTGVKRIRWQVGPAL